MLLRTCSLKRTRTVFLGLSAKQTEKLQGIVDSNMDIFRISLSSGPPATLPPLKIELLPDARPVKIRLRNYNSDQKEFLTNFVADLVRNGMAYANPTSRWACAPLLVHKQGTARFRFTVDLRPINKYTVRHHFPMPNLEQELSKLAGSRFFATFDLSNGYWQLPLDRRSQELQSFVTPDGVFTPTRVLHGTSNAVTHLQSALVGILPSKLRQHLLFWLDDILLHHSTADGLLNCIQDLFNVCSRHFLRLHPLKCILFATSLRWCGRLLSAKGIRYDPRQLDGLLKMEPPTTGAHLQQFLYALQWVKNGIPNFNNKIYALHDFMRLVYERAPKRTKTAVGQVKLSALGWNEIHDTAFENFTTKSYAYVCIQTPQSSCGPALLQKSHLLISRSLTLNGTTVH